MAETPHSIRYAITFGEVAILHVGGQQIGNTRNRGFSCEDLITLQHKLVAQGLVCEYYSLHMSLPEEYRNNNQASVLILRQGANFLLNKPNSADLLMQEQDSVPYDTKFFDRGQTKNKQARHNIVFASEGQEHSQDYRNPTIISFERVKLLFDIRSRLPIVFGSIASNLNAEGNKYHHKKSGIGFHGDSERKIVICLSLGKSMVLRYHWRLPGSSEHTFAPTDIILNHGDVYIMSEKATGWDWRKRSLVRVVHAAGYHANKC